MRIDIALGFDDRYAPHAAATIRSVVATSPGARFRFIILHDGVSPKRQSMIESVAPGAEFRWIVVGDDDFPEYSASQHFSRAILFRLGLDKLAPADCSRVLYLDTDVICTRDIRALWDVDLGGLPIGAVEDCYVKADAFARRWGLDADRPAYFNSGVALIDLERVRRDGGLARAMEFVARHGAEIELADQDALNVAFWGQWKKLDVIWNAQRHTAIPSLFGELHPHLRLEGRVPALIHYTTAEKPWVRGSYHPWAWLYWESLGRTPFAHEVPKAYGVGFVERLKIRLRWFRAQSAFAR